MACFETLGSEIRPRVRVIFSVTRYHGIRYAAYRYGPALHNSSTNLPLYQVRNTVRSHRTSWFKHKTPNFVGRECRMQSQLECHIPGIWYHADRHEQQWKRVT